MMEWQDEKQAGAAVAVGLFDGLHLGHLAVIRQAVEAAWEQGLQSAVLTFPFTSDNHPARKTPGQRLITPRMFRNLLREEGVEQIVEIPFSEVQDLSPGDFIDLVLRDIINARHVSCGDNFHFAKGGVATAQDLIALGRERDIQVTAMPMVEVDGFPVSSTRIRSALAAGEITAVNRMLGRRYSFDFTVVKGKQLGREIGFPTINQIFSEDYLLPRFGVYASVVRLDGKSWPGATNIGIKPTVGSDHPLAETHIIGYHGDLYGQAITVELIEYLREETRFADIDELSSQMERDCKQAEQTVERAI